MLSDFAKTGELAASNCCNNAMHLQLDNASLSFTNLHSACTPSCEHLLICNISQGKCKWCSCSCIGYILCYLVVYAVRQMHEII